MVSIANGENENKKSQQLFLLGIAVLRGSLIDWVWDFGKFLYLKTLSLLIYKKGKNNHLPFKIVIRISWDGTWQMVSTQLCWLLLSLK